MTTYKVTAKKSGRSKSGLTLDEALDLTHLSHADFEKVIKFGHPRMVIERETANQRPEATKAENEKTKDARPFWKKKRYAIPGLFVLFTQVIPAIGTAGQYALMSPEERAAYDVHQKEKRDRIRAEQAADDLRRAAQKASEEAADCWGNGKAFVQVAANYQMKKRLKSPGTAKFARLDDHLASAGQCEYIYTSHVDSQNSFGATVRTDFIAYVKITGKHNADIEIIDMRQR